MANFVQNQVKNLLNYALIRAKKRQHQADYFPVLVEDLTLKGLDKELRDYYGKGTTISTVAIGNWHQMTALQAEIEEQGEYAWVEYQRTGKQAVLKFGDNTYGTFSKEVRVIGWGSQRSCTEQMLRASRAKGVAA